MSKRTTEAESRYQSLELETLSVIYALKRFKIYLQGIYFKVVTDFKVDIKQERAQPKNSEMGVRTRKL